MQHILDGFNVTCFAYGMTGAGKTHTMIGNNSEGGLSFLAMEGIFRAM